MLIEVLHGIGEVKSGCPFIPSATCQGQLFCQRYAHLRPVCEALCVRQTRGIVKLMWRSLLYLSIFEDCRAVIHPGTASVAASIERVALVSQSISTLTHFNCFSRVDHLQERTDNTCNMCVIVSLRSIAFMTTFQAGICAHETAAMWCAGESESSIHCMHPPFAPSHWYDQKKPPSP